MAIVMFVLVLCLGALVPTFATPAADNDKMYDLVHLQKPDIDLKEAIRNAVPEPLLQMASTPGASAPESSNSRILYGQNAAEGQFPHQIALIAQGPNGQSFCGGSIIAPSCWILTAKHCVPDGVQWILVFAGSTKWQSAPYQVYVTSAYLHPNSDIALLKLASTLPTTANVRPVDLEQQGCNNDVIDNVLGDVSGWGRTSDSASGVTNDLQWVLTQTVSNAYCASFYGGIIVNTIICSVSPFGRNGVLCSGDSGGPLLWNQTGRQIGVNSFVSGGGCEAGPPSGYVRVPCFYDWIQAVIANNGGCP